MSFDLALYTVCNHRIDREVSALADDRRSLRVTKPIGATANLAVYASWDQVPGKYYTIVADPLSVTAQQLRMVYFAAKWKAVEDYFEVSYTTIRSWCPKCAGLGFLDDISYDVRGQLAVVRNEDLLLQNLEKFTVTELGSNPFHTFIGTNLVTLIGQRIYDLDYLISQITQEIYSTLGKFKDMQQQYIKTGRPVTKNEQLDQILDVKVTQDTSDPTIIRAAVRLTAMSGKPLRYTQLLRTIG